MYVRTRRYRSTRRRTKVLAFAPRIGTLRWVLDELQGEPYTVERVGSVAELVARLTGNAPQPRIAIADFDAMTDEELLHVELLRQRGWDGTVVALGRPEVEVRTALRIENVIPRPFGSETLRKAVSELSTSRPSVQDLR